MIRILIVVVILGFALLGVIAVVRMLLQGPRDEREKRDRR